MKILETERLILSELTTGDAAFIFKLVNDRSWLRYIGDKGVRNLNDARNYILNGPVRSYKQHGFGLYKTELKDGRIAIGICGLLKRQALQDPDVGFAFLPEFTGKGYATESASAVLDYAGRILGLQRIVAVTSPENQASINVLQKLGLRYKRMVRLEQGSAEGKLFVPGRMMIGSNVFRNAQTAQASESKDSTQRKRESPA